MRVQRPEPLRQRPCMPRNGRWHRQENDELLSNDAQTRLCDAIDNAAAWVELSETERIDVQDRTLKTLAKKGKGRYKTTCIENLRWESARCTWEIFVQANVPENVRIRRRAKGIRKKRADSRWLFHGTTFKSALAIMEDGFDPALRFGQCFGAGAYFSPYFATAKGYGNHIIVAEVHGGEVHESGDIVRAHEHNATPRAWIQVE